MVEITFRFGQRTAATQSVSDAVFWRLLEVLEGRGMGYPASMPLEAVEAAHIAHVLEEIPEYTAAARVLGITRRTLFTKRRALG